MSRVVLQQVFYCHWICAAGPYCCMTNMGLGKHVLSESAVSCPQFHNDHLLLSRKEVVCILSVILKMLLKPSFSYLSFTILSASSNVISCRSCGTFPPSFASMSASSFPVTLQWDGIHWMTVRSVDFCSVASDETSMSIS